MNYFVCVHSGTQGSTDVPQRVPVAVGRLGMGCPPSFNGLTPIQQPQPPTGRSPFRAAAIGVRIRRNRLVSHSGNDCRARADAQYHRRVWLDAETDRYNGRWGRKRSVSARPVEPRGAKQVRADVRPEGNGDLMPTTYILTWNPSRWSWDDYDSAIAQISRGEPYENAPPRRNAPRRAGRMLARVMFRGACRSHLSPAFRPHT
jgi:hypothetical protein